MHSATIKAIFTVDNLFNSLFGDVNVHSDLGNQVQIFSAVSQNDCTVH